MFTEVQNRNRLVNKVDCGIAAYQDLLKEQRFSPVPGGISTVLFGLSFLDLGDFVPGMPLFALGFHDLLIASGNIICRARRRRVDVTLCAGWQREGEQCKSQEQYDVFHIGLPQNNDAILHFVPPPTFFLKTFVKICK